jgi:hypothetical protein
MNDHWCGAELLGLILRYYIKIYLKTPQKLSRNFSVRTDFRSRIDTGAFQYDAEVFTDKLLDEE